MMNCLRSNWSSKGTSCRITNQWHTLQAEHDNAEYIIRNLSKADCCAKFISNDLVDVVQGCHSRLCDWSCFTIPALSAKGVTWKHPHVLKDSVKLIQIVRALVLLISLASGGPTASLARQLSRWYSPLQMSMPSRSTLLSVGEQEGWTSMIYG